MQLHELLRRLDPDFQLADVPDLAVSGIQEDSRQIKPGDLFVARAGTKTDGRQYINDAAGRGAVAVMVNHRLSDVPVPQVVVDDPSAAVARLAQIIFGCPTRELKVLGVTGTNGKTTTTFIVRHLLNSIGQRCGLIGTVEIDDGEVRRESEMTTPSPIDLARLMAAMKANGCRACIMETSSHSLDQNRVAGIRYAGAAFTNLTGDHLDYHKTMENYAAAKARMFSMLPSDGVAVINGEDEWANRMVQNCSARIVRFGFKAKADYRARDVSITSQGSNFTLHTPRGKAAVKLQMIGRHNIENALTAAALVGEVFGLSVRDIAEGLSEAEGAPGRLQVVRAGQKFAVLVDYAHTDDALENVLDALKPLTKGKLRVLFGCGGDRDRTKRPRMARVAQRLADVIYVTSDNPRTENPQSILDEISAGFSADIAKSIFMEIDRRKAIERVLNDATDEDVVLLAGKGHENYQIIGTVKHHFDDVEEATRVLDARSREPGAGSQK